MLREDDARAPFFCTIEPVQIKREPLILGIDSTTDVRSVALVAGTHVRAQSASSLRGAKAANLLSDIDFVLREGGAALRNVELFAVANGPGSFTGLRAGLATVKAFAVTLAKPVVGVPTLHAVASAQGPAPRVVAMLPAGRGEVFAQLLKVAQSGAVEELERPIHVSPQTLVACAVNWPQPLRWAGAGAELHVELLRDAAAQADIIWQDESDNVKAQELDKQEIDKLEEGARVWQLAPRVDAYAVEIARLALLAYKNGETSAAEELQALYVRPSDAELNERCRV